jgi:AmmeMemoRadiSam system protein A
MGPTPLTSLSGIPGPLRRRLGEVAWASIRHGLQHHRALAPASEAFPARLRARQSAFVTLYRDGALRGCVGSIEASRPLVLDVAANAYAAAFRDPRFEAVRAEELADLALHLSVLSARTAIPCGSEQDLCTRLRPGIDGVILELGERSATFLPCVWETLPSPGDFLRELRRKAGIPLGSGWPGIRAWRYTVESFAA